MKEPRYVVYKRVNKDLYEYAIYDRLRHVSSCYSGNNLKELFYKCSNKLYGVDYTPKYRINKNYIQIFETDNLRFKEICKKHPEYFI